MKEILLFAAVLVSSMAMGQTQTGTVRMSIPGVKGILEFEPGPTAWETRVRPDGAETQMRALGRPDHLNITAFLQKVKFAASPEKCRADWWKGSEKALSDRKIKLDHLQQSTKDGIARVEFMIAESQGHLVRMQDVHGYVGSRDLCAEVHMSKEQFVPDDQRLFEEVLATIRLLPDEAAPVSSEAGPSQTENEHLAQASRFYLQHNYAAASEHYQKVLDMEKQKRALNRTMFRVVVDNLGMSYGIPGNLNKAKETFEFGITQDPDYPLFYYNLACTYGEMGKMDEALEQLRHAFKRKANAIPGEGFPDPMTDDSFRKFVNNKKFVDAVAEMQK